MKLRDPATEARPPKRRMSFISGGGTQRSGQHAPHELGHHQLHRCCLYVHGLRDRQPCENRRNQHPVRGWRQSRSGICSGRHMPPHGAPVIFADETIASLDARTQKTVANISLGRRHMAHPSCPLRTTSVLRRHALLSSSSECYPRRMQPVSESFTWVTWDVVAIVPTMSQSPTQPERCTAAAISDSAG